MTVFTHIYIRQFLLIFWLIFLTWLRIYRELEKKIKAAPWDDINFRF